MFAHPQVCRLPAARGMAEVPDSKVVLVCVVAQPPRLYISARLEPFEEIVSQLPLRTLRGWCVRVPQTSIVLFRLRLERKPVVGGHVLDPTVPVRSVLQTVYGGNLGLFTGVAAARYKRKVVDPVDLQAPAAIPPEKLERAGLSTPPILASRCHANGDLAVVIAGVVVVVGLLCGGVVDTHGRVWRRRRWRRWRRRWRRRAGRGVGRRRGRRRGRQARRVRRRRGRWWERRRRRSGRRRSGGRGRGVTRAETTSTAIGGRGARTGGMAAIPPTMSAPHLEGGIGSNSISGLAACAPSL